MACFQLYAPDFSVIGRTIMRNQPGLHRHLARHDRTISLLPPILDP
jgi:hypothetical protein